MVWVCKERHEICANKAKQEKTAKYPLETGSSADAHDRREEYVEDEFALAAYSTLIEIGRTVMSKLVMEVALLCSSYVLEHKNPAKKNDLAVAVNLIGIV